MNVFILTDLEGISGVTDIEFIDRATDKYQIACGLLEKSLNLAIDTCFDCGAAKVYYLDGHGGGGNIQEEKIDPRAIKCSIAEWQALLQKGEIDCQIELGSHARAGTIGGFLDHTLSSKKIFCHCVNGREMSELSLHALICGIYGVPVVACIGDEAACEQAREYIPEIHTGAVKRAMSRNKAIDYENSDDILARTIKKALSEPKGVPPLKVASPTTVQITYYRTDFCEKALDRSGPEVTRPNARTLQRSLDQIKLYEELKF